MTFKNKLDKLSKWIFEPILDGVFCADKKCYCEKGTCISKLTKENSVITTSDKIVSEIHPPDKKILGFRPKNLKEYIGQRRLKQLVVQYLLATKKRKLVFPHTLIHGEPGMGKTTFVKIIAISLKNNFVEHIGGDEEFKELEKKIKMTDGGVLFIDEIHSLPRNLVEKMYPIMEDFSYDGKLMIPFTLMGATTQLGEIIRDKKPFYDRFKLILELEDYTIEDLVRIARQYKKRVFPKDYLKTEIYEILTKNCRGTPRTLIRLLEATIFMGDIIKVFDSFHIIKDGYTEKDLKVLKYIKENEKGVGLQGLCNYLDTSPDNYLYEIEPYLLKNGLIVRTARGRKITEQGTQIIKELEAK